MADNIIGVLGLILAIFPLIASSFGNGRLRTALSGSPQAAV